MMHTHIISGPSYATEHHQLSYLVCDLSHHTHTHTVMQWLSHSAKDIATITINLDSQLIFITSKNIKYHFVLG